MANLLINFFPTLRGEAMACASNLCVLLVFIGAFCGALGVTGIIAEYFCKEADRG